MAAERASNAKFGATGYWRAFWISVAAGVFVFFVLWPLREERNRGDQRAPVENVSPEVGVGKTRPDGQSAKNDERQVVPSSPSEEPLKHTLEGTAGIPSTQSELPVFVGDSLYDRSFRIEIVDVVRLDSGRLQFDILVRSLLRGVCSMDIVEPEKTAYIIDGRGNRYGFVEAQNMTGQFPGDVDVRASMVFLAPEPGTERINLVFDFRVGGGYPSHVIYRNLDLHSVKLVQPPPGNRAN